MKKIITSLLTSLTLIATCSHAALDLSLPDMNLPDMGDPPSSIMSYQEEQDLGKKLYRQLRRSQPVIDDPELSGWIRSLGNRLVSRASGTRGNFYFLIIDKPSVNAFAMPGGVVAVHTGLILNTESESELAAVLSHEIAHITQRHIARMFAKSKGSAWKTGLGVLAGAVAAGQDPELGQAVITASIASQLQKQLNFSREAETEADRVGIRILAAAGFDPEGMPNFLSKLGHSPNAYQNVTEFLRSHPLSINRVSDTRAMAKKYGNRPHKDDIDYLYAKAKLQAISRTHLRARGLNNPHIQAYAQACQSNKMGQFNRTLQLLGNTSSKPAEAIAIATALNGLHKYEQSIHLLEAVTKNFPDQEALIVPLAEAYLATRKNAKAWQLIRQNYVSEQSSLAFLDIRKEAAQASGNITEALISAAERYIHLGEYKHAQSLLQQATRGSSAIGAANGAKLQGLLNQVNQELKASQQKDKF